jgi:ABC-2 type transport system ATP-binding protein
MEQLYASVYERFSHERFEQLLQEFSLNPNKMLTTFSKGMRRQAATILALSCNADFILFDETFDGLDPVMRNLVKNLLYAEVLERRATAVITSHSLRELEDTCDQLALLHKGGIIFESDVEHLKTSLFKVQIAFGEEYDRSRFEGIDALSYEKQGSVATMIVRGDRAETEAKLRAMGPVLFEILPLSLEEVFVYEMGQRGYEFSEVLKQEVK